MSAPAQAPSPTARAGTWRAIVCGPAGGGPALVAELLAELGVDSADVEATPDDGGGAGWSWPGGAIRDLAAHAGLRRLGPVPAAGSSAASDVVTTVLLTSPDQAGAVDVVADLTRPETRTGGLVARAFARATGCDAEIARGLADAVGPATALVAGAGGRGREWTTLPEAIAAIQDLPGFVSLADEVVEVGGARLLDLGRALQLLGARGAELGDEWPLLAAGLSGRRYGASDARIVLQQFPGLFRVEQVDGCRMVRLATPLASMLLLGGVETSASEHYELYRVLRDRARSTFVRADVADTFVARMLPRQAVAADALEDLCADPSAVLSSDVSELSLAIEASPAHALAPTGKAILACAHRLSRGADRASQLELTARRLGLRAFVDRLTVAFPDRRWRPLWVQAQPAHTHRTLLHQASPVLALDAEPGPRPSVAFAGCGDGSLWRVGPAVPSTRIDGDALPVGEIRAVASASVDGSTVVVAALSGQAIAVVDGERTGVLWADTSTHGAPLSAVATMSIDGRATLASAGVEGVVHFHDLGKRSLLADLAYRHGAEIRTLRFVEAGERVVLAFGAVDGTVTLLDGRTGQRLHAWRLAPTVVDAIDAVASDGEVHLMAGCSDGSVHRMSFRFGGGDADGPVRVCGDGRAVTAVRMLDDVVLVSRTDGGWERRALDGTSPRRVIGHVAAVWALTSLQHGGSPYVITGGAEGTCRAWRVPMVFDEDMGGVGAPETTGAISTIALTSDAAGRLITVTGSTRGEVRLADAVSPESRQLPVPHIDEVTSVVFVPDEALGPAGGLASGSRDGVLRLTPSDDRPSTVLGIAHDGVEVVCTGVLDGVTCLASGGVDGTVSVWDMQAEVPRATATVCDFGSVTALAFLDEVYGGSIVSGGQNGVLSLLVGADLRTLWSQRLSSSILSAAALPSSERGFLAGLADGRVVIVTGAERHDRHVRELALSTTEIRGVGALVLDNRVVGAATGLDRRVHLFDVHSGTPLLDLELEGFGMSLAVEGRRIGVGTTAGAMVAELAPTLGSARHVD